MYCLFVFYLFQINLQFSNSIYISFFQFLYFVPSPILYKKEWTKKMHMYTLLITSKLLISWLAALMKRSPKVDEMVPFYHTYKKGKV